MALINMILLLCIASSGLKSIIATFDVTQYGAVGDGKTDDSEAFLKAWKATCEASDTPTLNVPSGKTFFLNPLVFAGPCQSAIQIQIDGNIIAPDAKDAWKNCEANTWIIFKDANNLNIQGSGTLDAKGSIWWDEESQSPPEGVCRKPTTFRLLSSNSTRLTGLKFLNSGGSHINIGGCNDLLINNITVIAPGDSPNTDGIDVIRSSRVQIRDSDIETGDDCIAINTDCFMVNISGITCGPGHGISVGSLGKDGTEAAVDGIYVEHCTFTKTEASARIKTWPGGSGYAKNIFYQHITLNDVQRGIEINQHYLNYPEKSKGVEVSQVHFINVHGTGAKILLDCSEHEPCQEIYLEDVNIASSVPDKEVNATCNHASVTTSTVTPQFSCSK